jgi:hypothetical protein
MKERIGIDNYEAFVLDYLEGNLSRQERKTLMDFFEKHPQLKADLEVPLEQLPAPATSLDPGFKEQLKKESLTELDQPEYLMIAAVEQQLSKEEAATLDRMLAEKPALLDELNRYRKAKLTPAHLPFPEKDKLYRNPRVIPLRPYCAAAASIAAAVLCLWLLDLNFDSSTYAPSQLTEINSSSQAEVPTISSLFVIAEVNDNTNSKNARQNPQAKAKDEAATYVAVQKEDKVKKPTPRPAALEQVETLAEMPSLSPTEEAEVKLPERKTGNGEMNAVTNEEGMAYRQPESQKTEAETAAGNRVDTTYTLGGYARKVVKKDLLKSKTFSEALVDELAALTNDQLKIEPPKKTSDKEGFALHIGSFSIQKK